MMTMLKNNWVLKGAATAAIVLATGCQNSSTPILHGEDFIPDGGTYSASEFVEAEIANGTRAESTLRPFHFDDAMINSLGAEYLDHMIHYGEANNPLIVYLDLSADEDITARRRQTVVAYLKDRGLSDEQIQIKIGTNPTVTSSTAMMIPAPGSGTGGSSAPANVTAPSGH